MTEPQAESIKRFVAGIRRLVTDTSLAGNTLTGVDGVELLYEMPAYQDLMELAYSLGFVSSELSADGFYFDLINSRPAENLSSLPLSEIRRYIHALYRCERHNWGWGSFLLESSRSGALGMAADRVEAGC